MGLLSSLKKFDIYRDVPKDLTEQTLTGALITVFCALLVSYLFISEFVSFLSVETHSEMSVDQGAQRQRMQVVTCFTTIQHAQHI